MQRKAKKIDPSRLILDQTLQKVDQDQPLATQMLGFITKMTKIWNLYF